MLKTYLAAIPLIALIPFLINSKIIIRRYFWIGFILGFMPFILWSYQYISIYSFATYSGLFERISYQKIIALQILSIIIFGTSQLIFSLTIPSFIGFFQASKLKKFQKYFLFFIRFLLLFY